jgi:DegV family protein with EDD domain
MVDVKTLKYFVRGGRVSPLKGAVARLLHLKPIISMNEEGKTYPIAKSFSPKMTMNKIVGEIEKMAGEGPIWNYSVVHALNPDRAHEYVERLRDVTGKEPAFVMGVSPVIGAHSGIGALGIAAMRE